METEIGVIFLEAKEHQVLMTATISSASLVTQMVKNLSARQEIQVPSLGWEDPLEKGMATNSSILAWRIPWTEEPGGLQSMGHKQLDKTEQLTLFTLLFLEVFSLM